MPKLALTKAFIITPFHLIEDGTVLINDSIIESVGPSHDINIPFDYRELSMEGLIIAPGLIDLHFHGNRKEAVMDGTRTCLENLARFQAVHGVTSFLATTGTAPWDQLISVASAYNDLQKSEYQGARCLGIHMEGPYLSPKFSGVHSHSYLRQPSFEEISILNRVSQSGIKLITMAPELSGATVVAFALYKEGIKLSIGHSNADYETVNMAIRVGFTGVTHCFEHLRPFELNEPGVIGGVLTRPEFWAEVIVNEKRVHRATLELLLKTKGFERLILASNGNPDFERKNGAQSVCQDIQPEDGATLDQSLRDFLKITDCDVTDAFRLATYNPARRMGINKTKGSLYPGKDADLIVLTPEFDIVMTMVEGKIISGLITL